jgi:hypothetical protein
MIDNLARKQKQRVRKLKKKVYKLNYLNEELEDIIQTVSEYSQEFRDVITIWFKQNNIGHEINNMFPAPTADEILENLSEDEIADVTQKNGKIDPWVKEIYRQIANKTHPDKIAQQENLGSAEKATLEKTFITANKHLEENDGPALYIIAVDLDLKMSNIPDNILDHFDKSISTLSEKIEQSKESIEWYWAESSLNDRIKFIENANKIHNIVVEEEVIALFLNDYTKQG